MKIAVDLGNQYVKAVSETGKRVIFRSVIAEGKRRSVFSLTRGKSNLTDSLQVTFGDGDLEQNFYVGRMAERFGVLPEYVFGKERFDTESAERLVLTAVALLVENDDPVDLALDFPYSQFDSVKDTFTKRLVGKTQTVSVKDSAERKVTIRSVKEFPQGLVAMYALVGKYQDALSAGDGYIALVDIGGGTTDVVVLEYFGDELSVHEELSGTLAHGMRDLAQTIRRSFEEKTGDMMEADLAERVVDQGSVYYGNQTWDFQRDVVRAKQNLAHLIKSQVSDLLGTRKNRIRTVFFVGGGAESLRDQLEGFHHGELFPTKGQWKNVEGCLIAISEPEEPTAKQPSTNAPEPVNHVQPEPVSTAREVAITQESNREVPQAKATVSDEPVQNHVQKPETTNQAHSQQTTTVPRRFQEGRGAW